MMNAGCKLLLSIILLCTTVLSLQAQEKETTAVIRALSEKINPAYPVLDSLYPITALKLSDKKWQGLSSREKKELRTALKKTKGLRLTSDVLPGKKLIPGEVLYNAFTHPDTANMKVMEENQPFYMLSAPVFFRQNTKAIIFFSLIKGFGTTFILERKNDSWTVKESIYGWM